MDFKFKWFNIIIVNLYALTEDEREKVKIACMISETGYVKYIV